MDESYVSSYLAKPHPSLRRTRRRALRQAKSILAPYHSQSAVARKLALGITLWLVLIGIFINIASVHTLPGESAIISTQTLPENPLTPANPVPPTLALPAGPTGQLLPPGVLAPAFSFANTYMRGQCTWYVAGRRQIPNNWGNARNWYYNAIASGWRVSAIPSVAAIAWTSQGFYGHVALVEDVYPQTEQVRIIEMNYLLPFEVTERTVPISSFKYIY